MLMLLQLDLLLHRYDDDKGPLRRAFGDHELIKELRALSVRCHDKLLQTSAVDNDELAAIQPVRYDELQPLLRAYAEKNFHQQKKDSPLTQLFSVLWQMSLAYENVVFTESLQQAWQNYLTQSKSRLPLSSTQLATALPAIFARVLQETLQHPAFPEQALSAEKTIFNHTQHTMQSNADHFTVNCDYQLFLLNANNAQSPPTVVYFYRLGDEATALQKAYFIGDDWSLDAKLFRQELQHNSNGLQPLLTANFTFDLVIEANRFALQRCDRQLYLAPEFTLSAAALHRLETGNSQHTTNIHTSYQQLQLSLGVPPTAPTPGEQQEETWPFVMTRASYMPLWQHEKAATAAAASIENHSQQYKITRNQH